MKYDNINRLGLKDISLLISESNFEYELKGKQIIINAKTVRFNLECISNKIIILAYTPIWFYIIFFILSLFITFMILYFGFDINTTEKFLQLRNFGGFFIFAGLIAGIEKFLPPILYQYSPNVSSEKKKISALILKASITSIEVFKAKETKLKSVLHNTNDLKDINLTDKIKLKHKFSGEVSSVSLKDWAEKKLSEKDNEYEPILTIRSILNGNYKIVTVKEWENIIEEGLKNNYEIYEGIEIY